MTNKQLAAAFIMLSIAAPALIAQDTPSLGDIARKMRTDKNKGAPAPAPADGPAPSLESPAPAVPANSQPAASAAGRPTGTTSEAEAKAKLAGFMKLHMIEAYQNGIRLYFDQDMFEALDQMTDKLRANKERLPGGFWKLHLVYGPLAAPVRGSGASESEWTTHLDRLKRWLSQRPQSVTARVALASAYESYAWKARGGGYADQVTEEGWRLFSERLDMAAQTLVDAFTLPTKDPEWYLIMQLVARGQGRSKATQAAIFEKAVAFEPDYQYYYRVQAESLLPKWGGEEGEMAAFAAQAADRLGGKRGDMIYYQIGTFVNCACDNHSELNGMSWPRIKSGYAAVEELYGESLFNLNQLASLAGVVGDPIYANELFERVGENWDAATWHEKKAYDQVREWAKWSAETKAIEAALKNANDNSQTPEGRAFDKKIAQTFAANYGTTVSECLKSTGEPFLMPFDLAMQVGAKGTIEKAYVSVITSTSNCVEAKVQPGAFPVPPRPSYWVKVHFNAQK